MLCGGDLGAGCRWQNHVLAVLPDRLRTIVQSFLESIPDGLKATMRRVCIDLWEGWWSIACTLPFTLGTRWTPCARPNVADSMPIAPQAGGTHRRVVALAASGMAVAES